MGDTYLISQEKYEAMNDELDRLRIENGRLTAANKNLGKQLQDVEMALNRESAEVTRLTTIETSARSLILASDDESKDIDWFKHYDELSGLLDIDSGKQCQHEWEIKDVLVESSVLPDVEVWKCKRCPATKKTPVDGRESS